MRRIRERDTPAHQAIQRFRRGVNFSNYLEAPRGQNWGASYTAHDFRMARREGFDHVRLPIAWQEYAGRGPDFKLSKGILAKTDFMVQEAVRNDLNVIVNVHNFNAFTISPSTVKDKFLAIWRQIARHYVKAAPTLAFELLNEPRDAATSEMMNPIYAEVLGIIRRSNPERTIFIPAGKLNQASELPRLRLPDDDLNLIVTVHCYDPFYFSHQGATWTGGGVRNLRDVCFPGPPSLPLLLDSKIKITAHLRAWIERYNTQTKESNPSSAQAFAPAIRTAQKWSAYYGRPVHMGEFGCVAAADQGSRARYYAAFRKALDEAGIAWAIWDWKAQFRYWNQNTNHPEPGMRRALFDR